MPVSDLISKLKSKDVLPGLERLFALAGIKDVSGVTILVPADFTIAVAAKYYPKHDNSTRKYRQEINDALNLMLEVSNSTAVPQWTYKMSFSPAAAVVLADIWKFQIMKEYIPPSVALLKYSSGGPWELPTMQGQPLWMSYTVIPGYDSSTVHIPDQPRWNISGASPQQQPSSPLPKYMNDAMADGSPFEYTLVHAGNMALDVPESEVVVYQFSSVLLPYNMDALGANAGGTAASLFHLLASVGLALSALMLL
ncbi:unnamed protein product [Closterium sp. NIES-64]|nr:unnamed protein product [Closterium sp. NIES-65]CAI5969916.1 unnamed protein product [Closterium sp. NIES-64]